MGENIFLLDRQERAVELRETQYQDEDSFQRLISEHPEMLDGVLPPSDDPRKWVFVAREFGVPDHSGGCAQWFLDHLLLDRDGVPTLVEVKRSSDSRIRREVVGQMLNYAADGCAYWTIAALRAAYEAQRDKTGNDPLAELLPDAEAVDAYWDQVEANLRSKKIRLLFVADQIPDSLRRIIEFLNEQMAETEVLGVEMRQYASGGSHRILVPRVIGRTTPAEQVKRQPDFVWTEERYLERARTAGGEAQADVCRLLLREFERMGCWIYWGRGRKQAGFVPIYQGARRHQLCAVYVYETRINIELYFEHFKSPFDREEKQRELQARFNEIPEIHVPNSRLKKRPSFDCRILTNPQNFQRFVSVYQAMLEEIRAFEAGQQAPEKGI